MRRKSVVMISASVAALITAFVLLTMGLGKIDRQETYNGEAPVKKISSILDIWETEPVDENEIVFCGKSEDLGFEGKAYYSYKGYKFFLNPDTGLIQSVIKYLDDSVINRYEEDATSGFTVDELLQKTDETIELVLGNEIADACERTVKTYQATVVSYDYIVDDIHVPKAIFILSYSKDLGSIILYDINLGEYDTNTFMSREESFEKANTEALEFMNLRYEDAGEELELDESSVIGEKTVTVNGDICWKWKLLYHWKDDRDMDPYFVITVDISTGEIIENENNYY